ncbi:hypothetical protein IQ273_09735 [Nodosilinea sp. LEGE 07298]|uniref:hypothetical protein n=1 Tax=Nodosilinea sp. LEGE 07298 TaxID=2777970 RepID=UPI001880B404|nr:hypothetical protein [Nodosilinea sp. LEGE 07298]MBE9109694.1 hypothetical protein [Nodosilinea sp. LEGE 07298]
MFSIHSRQPITSLILNSIIEIKDVAYEKDKENRAILRASLVANLILMLSILCEATLSEILIDSIESIDIIYDDEKSDRLKAYLLQRLKRSGWEEISGVLCEVLIGETLSKIVGQELNNQLKALFQKRNMIAHGESIERFTCGDTRKDPKIITEKFSGKSSAFSLLQDAGIIPVKGIHNLSLSDIYSIQMY